MILSDKNSILLLFTLILSWTTLVSASVMTTSPFPLTIGSLKVTERDTDVSTPTASSAGVVNVMNGFSSSHVSVALWDAV